jgi:hypothetical protein
MSLWQWFLSCLAWLAADPAAVDVERPRAAAAVAVAYASFAPEQAPPAPPTPVNECACGGTCVGGKWKPDGHIVQPCPCPASCKCKAGKCPDGKCPQVR